MVLALMNSVRLFYPPPDCSIIVLLRPAGGTKERSICDALPDSALLSVCVYASAPAGARYIATSEAFLRASSHFSSFISLSQLIKLGWTARGVQLV
jgi:hypothetical protein